jgi:signal transduction histidine kinase/CheY-like chemotaxis protein
MQYDEMSREELIQEIARLDKELQDLRARGGSGSGEPLVPGNLLRLMCDNVPDLIWAKDIQKNYLFANKAICEQLLKAENTEEPLGKNDLFFAQRERSRHAENSQWHTFGEICQESDEIVLASRESRRFDEYGNVQGEFLYLDVHKAPFWDEAGNLIGTVGSARNVTKDRKFEEELRRREARFKAIFNNTDISIWEEDFSQLKAALNALKAQGVTDIRSYLQAHPGFVPQLAETIKVLDVNNATLELYGAKSKEELLGDLGRILLPETLPMLQAFVIAIAEGQPRFEYETVNQGVDGRILNVLIRLLLPKEDEEYGNLLLCILDITAKKQLEAEQRRSQKLDSLGVLVGGIAHDFNNLLMGITGSISMAKMHMEACENGRGSKPMHALENAEKACERAKSLTHQLLTFARGGAPVKKVLAVRSLLTSAVSFGLSGSNVRCEFTIPEDTWNIEADENQLIQVISNIVINGVEAMPEAGTIKVRARNRHLQESEISKLPSGKVVEITICDHGVGISEEHLHRVFDPYFTGKQGGRGLGLAIAYSVILKHGGHVVLDSELGLGTSVTIFLPATEANIQEEFVLPDEDLAVTGSVLVMDDEEVVRAAATAMLEFLGYTTETAVDGAEMLARYQAAQERGEPFDLVIMDLTIPGGMGGVEGIKELLALDPSAKAIVSSGYSNDPVMANHQAYGFVGVVPKPYRIGDLDRAIRNVLTGIPE